MGRHDTITATRMPSEDIKVSNDELTLMISALELAARLLPEADVDPKLVSAKAIAVDHLLRRLMRIALDRGLRTA